MRPRLNLRAQAHTMRCDLETDFLPYAEKQCVQYTNSGDIVYNFGNAEQFLLTKHFANKPLLELELRMFQVSGVLGAWMPLVRRLLCSSSMKVVPRAAFNHCVKRLSKSLSRRNSPRLLSRNSRASHRRTLLWRRWRRAFPSFRPLVVPWYKRCTNPSDR